MSFRKKKSVRSKKLYTPLIALVMGMFVIFGCILLFSAIAASVDVPSGIVSLMGTVALCAGGFTSGFVTGKHKRRYGMKNGLKSGVLIYGIVFIAGTIFMKKILGFSMITKLIMLCICGAIGGIYGVNTKIKKPPI